MAVPLGYHKPVLTLLRRHNPICKKRNHFSTSEIDRCQCPLAVMGMDGRGVYHNRESLHTRDRFLAMETIREIETGKIVRPKAPEEEKTVESAMEGYVSMLRTEKGLKETTLAVVESCQRSLIRYCQSTGVKYIREVSTDVLSGWISSWKMGNQTRHLRIGMVKKMFGVMYQRKWLMDDPALPLMKPKRASGGSTLPFDQDEVKRIIEALPRWRDGMMFKRRIGASVWSKHPDTAVALVTLLRITGLRISDAFMFNPRSLVKRTIHGEEMYLYYSARQRKTTERIFLPFTKEEVQSIVTCKWISEEHAFWDGKSDLQRWNNLFIIGCLRFVEKVSGVVNIHPHRFRDTFAVELLTSGADIRSVSRLLGHQNPATTLSYYEHFVTSDQDKLVEVMRKRGKEMDKVIQFPSAV